MKILVIIPSLRRGGAERAVSLLTQEWSKAHEVQLAVFDASQPAYAHGGRLTDLSVPAKGGAVQKAGNAIRRIGCLIALLRRERPDRIISFMESANFPAILASAATGYLHRLTISVRNDPARFPRGYRWLIPLLYRLPARVVAVSQGVARALADMGVPSARLRAIPNPAPQDMAVRPAPQPTKAPAKYVLAVGRLHPQKGFDRLLHAFADISDPDMHLVILGEGNERVTLEALAQSLGIAARVGLPGAVADPTPWYQHAECFVLSSRHEGWPNVLMEAMSNGCPVVSYDCRYGPSEIIEHGVSGLLVEDGDIEGLRDAIIRVLVDPNLCAALIKKGLSHVREFAVERVAGRWLTCPNRGIR